jgi:type VI secretion system protein ImpC
MEGAWRGLNYLISNTETDEMLKIRVQNISKKELGKELKKYKGTAWDQSPIFKQIYEQEYGQFGGEPYGCLVGDFYFDHSPQDVELLSNMAQISAASHCPFISAADSSVMQMDSWQELSNPRDLTKIFQTPEYAAWRSLRDSEDARYLCMTMPRTLSRLPYGSKTDPVDEFDFEEDTNGADHSNFAWQNSAYAMAVNINRSFKEYGWCSRIRGIESGGAVQELPVYSFPTDDGGADMKCPTEIAISDRREAELAKNGFMPLIHKKNSDMAAFIGAQSLQKPVEYDDPDATANANLAARLPYLFATCRFAHYLKCIVRDKVGSFKERADMERWLGDWILNYVDGDPENSSETTKAEKPLAAAEVRVQEVEGNPGYYTSQFFLRPHYQLEGLTVSLRLVSKLPSAKAG